jgi:hypothetical protein
MAATVGLGPDSSRSQNAALMDASMPPPPAADANWAMSNPAEKARSPSPVMTMAAQAGSAWARRRQSKRARRTGEDREDSGVELERKSRRVASSSLSSLSPRRFFAPGAAVYMTASPF